MTTQRTGRTRPTFPLLALLASAAIPPAFGCGARDPDRFDAVPASGTVTYKGESLTRGFVQFVPGRGRSASGQIGEDGRFALTTYDDKDDGAVPGTHQVGVIVTEEVPSRRPGGEPEVNYIVPRKFADPATSGISVEIPPSGRTDIVITID